MIVSTIFDEAETEELYLIDDQPPGLSVFYTIKWGMKEATRLRCPVVIEHPSGIMVKIPSNFRNTLRLEKDIQRLAWMIENGVLRTFRGSLPTNQEIYYRANLSRDGKLESGEYDISLTNPTSPTVLADFVASPVSSVLGRLVEENRTFALVTENCSGVIITPVRNGKKLLSKDESVFLASILDSGFEVWSTN